MSHLLKSIVQLVFVVGSIFSADTKLLSCCHVLQSGQFEVARNDNKIPDGSWILVGIERNGEDVTLSLVKKYRQVLLIKDDIFALFRDDVRGMLGTVTYDKPQDAHNTVSFYETNPFDGTFNE